jgi:CspA family cold shock protein
MHGHITGLPDMSANDANERNELAHSRLAFLSFLYSACEEFATILDGYELSNPYTRKIQGTVNFFHDERNYGFIERDDALESDNGVFFHIKDVEGSEINEGEQVLFNVIEGDEGPQAKNLKRV